MSNDQINQNIKEEVYNTLNSIEPIKNIIKLGFELLAEDETDESGAIQISNRSLQDIEKNIDDYIINHVDIVTVLQAIYQRYGIDLPPEKTTERNQIITAKKRLIKEVIEEELIKTKENGTGN